jgi:hypothetical protein
MNWLNVFGLSLLAVVIIFMALRAERGRMWVIVALLVVPGAVAVGRWAQVGGHWSEAAAGLAIAVIIAAAWWLAGGRRLSRPTSDVIKVWGQEKVPKPKPGETATLQAEVARLREDRARLEQEVNRLKADERRRTNSGDEGRVDDGRRTTPPESTGQADDRQ